MVRIDVVINDEIAKELRIKSIRKFGGKKGDLSKAVEEAIRKWIKEEG